MIIDDSLILKLEKLARLELSADERVRLRSELEEIVDMINKLEECDTTGVEPLMHLSGVENVVRDDQVEDQLDLDQVLKNAPISEAPYFKVPKVIKRNKKK